MKDIIYMDELGNNITISNLGMFKIPELEKEYIIYSVLDDDSSNDEGKILIGEVVRDNNNYKVLGVLENEIDLVTAYYNEISNQLGGK